MTFCFRALIAPFDFGPQGFECFAPAQATVGRRHLPFGHFG
jgi:hypothetical protein